MSSFSHSPVNSVAETEPAWVALVREKVEDLHYGTVQITVHDGRVIQIERSEKTRLTEGRERGLNASAL